MADMPRWYLPTYLAIKLPLVLLHRRALALGLLHCRACRGAASPRAARETALLAFIVVFPVAAGHRARARSSPACGISLFVVPPLAVLAGVGFDALIARSARWRPRPRASAAALRSASLWNASMLVRLHPHEYLFYNPLVGGLAGRRTAAMRPTIGSTSCRRRSRSLKPTYATGAGRGPPAPTLQRVDGLRGARCSSSTMAGDRLHWTDDWEEGGFLHLARRIWPATMPIADDRARGSVATVRDWRSSQRRPIICPLRALVEGH